MPEATWGGGFFFCVRAFETSDFYFYFSLELTIYVTMVDIWHLQLNGVTGNKKKGEISFVTFYLLEIIQGS